MVYIEGIGTHNLSLFLCPAYPNNPYRRPVSIDGEILPPIYIGLCVPGRTYGLHSEYDV